MFEGIMTPTMLSVSPGSLVNRSPGAGKVFFVGGPNASDDNEGSDPQRPLSKIATALALCSDGGHDYVFVQDYWDNDAFPVAVNKQCAHIVGLGNGNPMGIWPLMNCGAAVGLEIGAAGFIEIAGLSIITDATHACLESVAGDVRAHIHHMAFGVHGAAQDGILSISGGELARTLVEHCVFGMALVRDGVRVYSPSWSFFINNIFREYGGIGINLYGPSAGRLGGIINNRFFKSQAGDVGCAITIIAAQMGIVTDNVAAEDGANPGNNPYQDTSGTGTPNQANAWGLNYSGNAAVYPA